jgi:predicted dehydrogenase
MGKVGLCVVGCGGIAERAHLKVIRRLEKVATLEAVVDVIEERAERAAKEYGAKKCYFSTEEAFRDPEIDAVVLCLPHYLHCPVAVEAARSGKHILVEKPMALTVDEADKMIEEAERHGVKLMVGQNYRFFDATMEAKKHCEASEIGRMLDTVFFWTQYRRQAQTPWSREEEKCGGYIIPLEASHIIDLILWLFDKQPTRVYAEAFRNNPDWEGEDEATIMMGFNNQAMATAHLSKNLIIHPTQRGGRTEGYCECFVIGSNGGMHITGGQYHRPVNLIVNDRQVVSIGEQDLEEVTFNTFVREMEEFISSIREDRQPLASGAEVRKTIAVLEAARNSYKNHSIIVLQK